MLCYSCGSVKDTAVPELKEMPTKFSRIESDEIKPIDWQQFFGQKQLKAIIDTALANNLDLKSGVQKVLVAGANLRLTKAQLLPNVTATITGGLDRFGKYTMNGVGNYDTNFSENINANQQIPTPTPDYFGGFRSSWEIDIWGKLGKRKEAAYNRFLASQNGLKWYKTQLVCQVAELYYELIALDKKLEILQRNIKLQSRGLEIVEAQMAGGRATSLAVSQFKAQQIATKGKQYEILQGITRIENQLNALSGSYDNDIIRDTTAITKLLPKKILAGIAVKSILARPDIKEAELRLAASKADVVAARKAFLPSLTLDAYVGYNAFKLPLLFSPGSLAAGFLGGLSAPVLNRANLKNNSLVANANQLSAFYNYQNSIVKGYQEVDTQLSAITNYKWAFEHKTQEVKELKTAVSSANDLYLAGYASYLEVIVAQASVLNAEMEQVDLQLSSYQSMIGLYRALGGS